MDAIARTGQMPRRNGMQEIAVEAANQSLCWL